MATRFGAVSPAHTYATKVRWLVGGLVAVIVVLLITLIMLFQSDESSNVAEQSAATGVAVAATPTQPSGVEILYSVQRVEEGARLDEFMLEARPVDPDKVPEGAVYASEKETILGQFAGELLNANMPLLRTNLRETRPVSALNIPPGFRAVTITVDARAAVEGWAKPNTRVDVLWAYQDKDGAKKVATIVRFVKILSVRGQTSSEAKTDGQGPSTVTLLVSEQDAKKIELARTLGALSLSLVGDQEQGLVQGSADSITIDDILGNEPEQEGEEPHDGVMYTQDSKTGKQVRYVLKRGRWVRDAGF